MAKTSTHALSSSPRKHAIGFLVKDLGVPKAFHALDSSLHSCSKVRVRIGRVKSPPFTVAAGLREGCVLSLLFFIVNTGLHNPESSKGLLININLPRAANIYFISMWRFHCSMEEILEQQLLIRGRVFATFSTIEKALAGRKKSFRRPYVVQAGST